MLWNMGVFGTICIPPVEQIVIFDSVMHCVENPTPAETDADTVAYEFGWLDNGFNKVRSPTDESELHESLFTGVGVGTKMLKEAECLQMGLYD